MRNQATQAVELATKIAAMAEIAIADFGRTIKNWPPEYQAIIWEAVADVAFRRAEEARRHPL
jgi:hypothetical protein